ncbi:MAG: sigma-70 family RNA polymerase sigma factor [Erysipelotrichaceae bacterium]|nr:sigma-70 family RNA polymerase sigma factor [Erysipelotrichaceae bacterium]
MENNLNLEDISKQYDSYIKKTIRNFKADYIRKNASRWENELYLEELPFAKREDLMKDETVSDNEKMYVVNGRLITKEMIHKALNLLPEKKSVVIKLHYFDNLNEDKIAEQLGLSQEGVSKRIRTALKILMEIFEDIGDGECI